MKESGNELKSTIVTLVIILAVIASFAIYNIQGTKREILELHKKIGTDRTRLMAQIAGDSLKNQGNLLSSKFSEMILNRKDSSIHILEYAVVSREKRFIEHSDPEKTGLSVIDPDLRQLLNNTGSELQLLQREGKGHANGELLIVAPINVEGEKLGDVVLVTSLEPVDKIVNALTVRSAMGILLLMLIVAILVFRTIRNSTLPIYEMSQKVKKLADEGKIEKLVYDRDGAVGELISSINTMMDNWEKLYEEQVQRLEEADAQRRLSDAVVENIANGILVLDREGVITRANRSVEFNMNLSAASLTGKPFWEVFPGWENEDSEQILRRVLETGDIYSNERVYYNAPIMNLEVVFNVSICPIKDQADAILGTVVLFEFLTDKVLLEEHLLRANEDLKRANDVKSEFLSMVSHELRTPLTLIKMYSAMLADKKIGPLTEKQEKAVEVMNRRCRNLHELIDDLLDLSKIESGHLDMYIQETSLQDIVKDASSLYKTRAESAGIELHIEADQKLPPVLTDRDKISRVLNNLLENALKFTEKGEIRIRAERDPKNDRQARITVMDTGCGIPAEYQEKVFEKFFQIDGSDTRKHSGSGLGLSIASEIVALHQGRLWLESSSEDEGTCFCFNIPFTNPEMISIINKQQIYTGESGVKEKKSVVSQIPPGGRNVLLIDDDQDFLDMMSDALTDDGFTVHSATNGLEGIEILFSGEPIDIILLDVTMPKISGYEVCRMIKSLDSTRSIPVLMLTAAGQDDQIESGYSAGAAGYLVKPFTLEAFRNTMLRIMGGGN